MPGNRMVWVYSARPVTLSRPSRRGTERPICEPTLAPGAFRVATISAIRPFRPGCARGAPDMDRISPLSQGTNSKSVRQVLRPFRPHAIVERLARAGDDREGLLAAERDAGIDHDARIAAIGFGVVAHRG